MTSPDSKQALGTLRQIAASHAAAKQYFANHEPRADEIKDRQHVETVGILLDALSTTEALLRRAGEELGLWETFARNFPIERWHTACLAVHKRLEAEGIADKGKDK